MGKISYWYNDLKEKLSSMNFRQKVSYLFTYYRSWLVWLLILILFACFIGDFIIQRNRETLLEGFFTNDDYVVFDAKDINREFSALAGIDKHQQLIMDDNLYIATDGSAKDYSAASNGKIIAYMSVGELDFIVTRREIYDYYAENVPMLDISSVLDENLTEKLSPYFQYGCNIDADGQKGEPFPAAIELSQCRFLRDRDDVPEGTYYLFIPYQAPHRDMLAEFIEYLFSQDG